MIAISVTSRRKNAIMDLRFGRAPFFCLYDGKDISFIENPFCEDEHDIAPRLVNLLHQKNVKKIITGEIGPKAKMALEKNQIQIIILSEDRISLQGILKKIN